MAFMSSCRPNISDSNKSKITTYTADSITKEPQIQIDGTTVEIGSEPFIVAEMSGNHSNSLPNAIKLLKSCAQAGANAFKAQTYKANSITLQSTASDYMVRSGIWAGRSLYDLYSQGETPREWLPVLKEVEDEEGITFFSSPFSPEDVTILENIDVKLYKVASFELTYTQLLREIARTHKPVIFSTGLATLQEIQEAVEVLIEGGSGPIAILKCTSTYPADTGDLNLCTIPHLAKTFNVPIGFSDHTEGDSAAIAAVALGATILEKHVKLDEDSKSVDSAFSLPVSRLHKYIQRANEAYFSIGKVQDGPTANELANLRFRRSIVASRDIREGETLTPDHIAIVRPDIGLAPKEEENVIGRVARKAIPYSKGISWDDLY